MLHHQTQIQFGRTEEPLIAKLIDILPHVISAACAAAAIAGFLQ